MTATPDLDHPALFDLPGDDPEPAAPIPRGEAMRRRIQTLIDNGFHPLAFPESGAPNLRLHPAAPRNIRLTGDGGERFRCGTCRFREMLGGHARSYPKCLFGYREEEIPERMRHPHGPSVRVIMPRVSGGERTDVRAGWPGCVDWRPIEPATEPATEPGPGDRP